MDPDLPERLHSTRDLLTRSLVLHPREQAPAMPAGLAADLTARFAAGPAIRATATPARWMEKVRTFLAAPGFGLAAAAVVVVGVTVPMLTAPDVSPAETFRGDNGTRRNDTVRIAFVGENPKVEAAVKSSGNFEPLAFIADADSLPGPKVVIHFREGTVTAFDATGTAVHTAVLPAKPSDVAGVLADAISRL